MSDDELQPMVGADYEALAALLDGQPAGRWDIPSLCAGWRVREVVAHVTMPARYGEEEFMARLRDAGFDFTKLSNQIATEDARLPPAELIDNLRDDGLHHWAPPGGGFAGALNHVVIHALDVTVPLGEPRVSPDATMRAVLDGLTAGGAHAHFGTDISERSLHATDLDWSFGSGPELRGPAADLALHICGRVVPDGRLVGEKLGRSTG